MVNKKNGGRVILFPLPLQGIINPMLQLANILYSKGFSITIIHTRFHAPKASNHPLFTFLEISDGLSETQIQNGDAVFLLTLLNKNCEDPLRDCLAKLMSETEDEKICCLIDDCGWFFTQSVAESFNLPRLVLCAYKFTFFLGHFLVPQFRRQGYHQLPESEADDVVLEFPLLRKKDLRQIMQTNGELLDPYLLKLHEAAKLSSGLIVLSCQELDQDSLTKSQEHDFTNIPIFPIGPFHIQAPASSSSLIEPDQSCIHWLDKQETGSVIYVSFGSIVTITKSDFLEIAWGLSNSNQPFLWVLRSDSIQGSDWIELLPKGFNEIVEKRGKIVKWAPQRDVLAHRATGGFLTHSGWNSTLESISEGVPMICLPFIWDQMLNARFVSEIWRIGIHLEGGIDKREIEKAVRRLMVEEEGEEIRERILVLKDEIERSVKEGSASGSLHDLVDHILSL